MMETEEKRIELAMIADREEIAQYVHDPSTKVIRALLGNRHLTEDEVLIIASRKNIPANILETIAKDKRWAESYPVRLALARNPKSPLSISLSIARYLRLFDLEEIARCHFIPLAFRHKVETMIIERIPTLPLGNKKTLAKKAAGNVLLKLLQDSNPDVVQLCLNNPHLVEGHLYKVISRAGTVAKTIQAIATHPNWSSRSLIRFSLARNDHTPVSLSVRFLRSMKIMDLRELYADPSLPVTIKPFVHRELWERGQQPEKAGGEQIYEIDEKEMEALDAEVTRYTIDVQEGESTSREQD
ncbi:MAG TPA: hypothetical protein VMM54_05860 [Nitrospirota bacterium]|nr:hypothetical protein [Nitrospirota bacterium]